MAIQSDRLLSYLPETSLFFNLPQDVRDGFVREARPVPLVGGDTLMERGDPGDCMYLLVSGRLHVLAPDPDGAERFVAEIGPGETVGEAELISGETRSVTIRASRDSELLKLSKDAFDRLIASHPALLIQLTRLLVARLKRATHGTPSLGSVRTLAILPAGTNAPVADFAETLAEVLGDLGPVLCLDSAAFDRHLGTGASRDDVDVWDETDSRIVDWLNDQETAHRFTLFVADSGLTPWTRRCVRMADRVLLVGRAAAEAALTAPERFFFGPNGSKVRPPSELVLLHDDVARLPTGTRAWLELRPVHRHHHVHLGTRAHLERLVRFLTGRAVGVVLGGGGARGSTHIGVLQALAQAGIPVDMIGGTSAGGGIAAQYAMGLSFPEIRDLNYKAFVANNPFKQYTVPIVSLVAAGAPDTAARSIYGDLQVEDLWISFFCVSCNLSTGETIVHQSGPLWKAVRSTTSLPGVLAPVVEGRHLLVDGGLVDNLPVMPMKELCGGPVIVVNISPDEDLVLDDDLYEIPSPWEILKMRLGGSRRNMAIPTIAAVMSRLVVVNSIQRKNQAIAAADLYLNPPVSQFGMLEFEALDEMIRIGREYAAEQIEGWRESGLLAEKLRGVVREA